ncbi:hypothetical protein AgCh_002714 [Apium graveolens]
MATASNLLATSRSSSSSSSSRPKRWDVFLSFHGMETGKNFVSHLYSALDQAGISTFLYDPTSEEVDERTRIEDAVLYSKMFIVVVSDNFLPENIITPSDFLKPLGGLSMLAGILRFADMPSPYGIANRVIPVFYYVAPSDVRHLRGDYQIIETLKEDLPELFSDWKGCLVGIAALSGYHLKKEQNENESKIIQEIVDDVVRRTCRKVLHLEQHLVQIDFAVEEVFQKLSMESNDVRAIGICGMGGIGKTTIAKVFYNTYSNYFEISCFIEIVKEFSQGGSPLLPLLQQILIELLGKKDYKVRDVESGIRHLKQILFSKKVLIVLDDLDQLSYSEFLARFCNLFSGGSRIIITTRDVNLLNQLKTEIPEVEICMVKKLGQLASLELFRYYAFGKSTAPESLRKLSESFATYAGGLPLALKVLGSSLRGRTNDVLFWEAKLEKLKKIPENGIHKILQLSYDELDDETLKAMFLDIAFFFVGKDKTEAVHVFKSCDFYPEVGIPILVERCLLSIDKNNKFQMHNLIKDMGKELGKSTHLFLQGDEWKNLQNLEGPEKIEGLILNLTVSTDRQISSQIFRRLTNLRLLEVVHASDIKGNFKDSFHELRCIRWSYCPWTCLPSSFCPQKLVTLDVPGSKFKILWNRALPLVNLKTMDVSYSVNLKTTSDFRHLKLVEKLSFRGCESLLEVHPSIGQLTELIHLDLSGCGKLEEWDESIRQKPRLDYLLVYLTYLFLFLVSKLDYLRMYRSVKRLPDPIKQLTNLSYLSLNFCRNLKRLPDQLGDMKGLKTLDARYTPIEQLPDSITRLKDLERLELTGCFNLSMIPMQVGDLESLKVFIANGTAIRQLPDSFVDLPNLVKLSLGYCVNLTSLPDDIWKLKFLKTLDVEHCSKLESLPLNLGLIRGLETLDVSYTAIEELPVTIILLSELQVLDLSHCEKLKDLPDVWYYFKSLKSLSFDGADTICQVGFPVLVRTMELEYLTLKCDIKSWLPIISTFSCLKALYLNDEGQSFAPTEPYSLSMLSNLKQLTVANCTSLGSSFPELPLSLTYLRIHKFAILEQLPDLSSLKQLNHLYISNCVRLHSLPPLPPRMQGLIIYNCTSLKDVSDFSMLKELVYLTFGRSSTQKPFGLNQSLPQVERDSSSSHTEDVPNMEGIEFFRYTNTSSTQNPSGLTRHERGLFSPQRENAPNRKVTEYLRSTNSSSSWKPSALNQSLHQVDRDFFNSYMADVSNRKITEWFRYTNSGLKVSLEIPSIAEDDILGVRLLVVFTCKTVDRHYILRAVINNETEGRRDFYEVPVYCMRGAEVQTLVECIRAERISVRSGDKIEIVFFESLYASNGCAEAGRSADELTVNMCGAHVMQRTPSTPHFSSALNEYLQLVSGN